MSNHLNKITRIEIKSLWDRFDLMWELDTDVNILSGINGSGKSTILSCIANLIINGQLHETLVGLVEKVIITFNNDKSIVYEHLKINDTIKNIEKKQKKMIDIKR